MKYLDGRPVAQKILGEVSKQAKQMHARGVTPTIAVVLVGENPSSELYVQKKKEVAKKVGIDFLLYKIPSSIEQKDLEELFTTLYLDETVHGVVSQLPLPEHLNLSKLIKFIAPEKDIDHFHENSPYSPPTASAVIELLKFYEVELKNKKVAVLGNGFLVGKPLSKILKGSGAQVNVYTEKNKDIAKETAKADVLISATGQPHLIKKEFTNTKQIIVDVGSARDKKTNVLVGDVDRQSVGENIEAITPMVGGVGPITIALLLKNVILAAKKHCNNELTR